MRRVAFGFAAIGIVAVVYVLVPKSTGGRVLYSFSFAPTKSPAYYQAAETALDAWLVEQGFARVEPGESGELRYQVPAIQPPLTVSVAKPAPSGPFTCTFDWASEERGWFESEGHQRARAFSGDLKLWRDRYLRLHP